MTLAINGYVNLELYKPQKDVPTVIEHFKDLQNAVFQPAEYVAAIAVDNSRLNFYCIMEFEADGKKHYCFHYQVGDNYPKDLVIVERINREFGLHEKIQEIVIHGTGKYAGLVFRKPLKNEEYMFCPGEYGYYSLLESGLVDVCTVFVTRNKEFHCHDGDKIFNLQSARTKRSLHFPVCSACCDVTIELYSDGSISIN